MTEMVTKSDDKAFERRRKVFAWERGVTIPNISLSKPSSYTTNASLENPCVSSPQNFNNLGCSDRLLSVAQGNYGQLATTNKNRFNSFSTKYELQVRPEKQSLRLKGDISMPMCTTEQRKLPSLPEPKPKSAKTRCFYPSLQELKDKKEDLNAVVETNISSARSQILFHDRETEIALNQANAFEKIPTAPKTNLNIISHGKLGGKDIKQRFISSELRISSQQIDYCNCQNIFENKSINLNETGIKSRRLERNSEENPHTSGAQMTNTSESEYKTVRYGMCCYRLHVDDADLVNNVLLYEDRNFNSNDGNDASTSEKDNKQDIAKKVNKLHTIFQKMKSNLKDALDKEYKEDQYIAMNDAAMTENKEATKDPLSGKNNTILHKRSQFMDILKAAIKAKEEDKPQSTSTDAKNAIEAVGMQTKEKEFKFVHAVTRAAFFESCMVPRPAYFDDATMARDLTSTGQSIKTFAKDMSIQGDKNGVKTICQVGSELVCLPNAFCVAEAPACSLKVQWRLPHVSPIPSLQMVFILLNRYASLLCLVRLSANSACAIFESLDGCERVHRYMTPIERPRLLIGRWWYDVCQSATNRTSFGNVDPSAWLDLQLLQQRNRKGSVNRKVTIKTDTSDAIESSRKALARKKTIFEPSDCHKPSERFKSMREAIGSRVKKQEYDNTKESDASSTSHKSVWSVDKQVKQFVQKKKSIQRTF